MNSSNPISEDDIFKLANSIGLEKAVKLFPNDVKDAAKSALNAVSSCPIIDDLTQEPWPPMFVRSSL